MYERFTDRARKAMQLANQQAQLFNHEYIGVEHVLLGILKEGTGVACNVLKSLDIDIDKTICAVKDQLKPGPNMITMGRLPNTPRTKKAIEKAVEYARDLNHNYIGTEHLLMGLLCCGGGVADDVLRSLGVSAIITDQEIRKLLDWKPSSQKAEDSANRVNNPSFCVECDAVPAPAAWTCTISDGTNVSPVNQLLKLFHDSVPEGYRYVNLSVFTNTDGSIEIKGKYEPVKRRNNPISQKVVSNTGSMVIQASRDHLTFNKMLEACQGKTNKQPESSTQEITDKFNAAVADGQDVNELHKIFNLHPLPKTESLSAPPVEMNYPKALDWLNSIVGGGFGNPEAERKLEKLNSAEEQPTVEKKEDNTSVPQSKRAVIVKVPNELLKFSLPASEFFNKNNEELINSLDLGDKIIDKPPEKKEETWRDREPLL